MTIERINPDTLHKNPAFTQVAKVSAGATLVFVGGQNGVDSDGQFVGDDIASQSAQALRKVIAALEAAGATLNDVVKMTLFMVEGQSIQEGFGAVQPLLRQAPPSTVTMAFVAGLGRPEALIEIEAVAAVSAE